jgi:hypothetical protein
VQASCLRRREKREGEGDGEGEGTAQCSGVVCGGRERVVRLSLGECCCCCWRSGDAASSSFCVLLLSSSVPVSASSVLVGFVSFVQFPFFVRRRRAVPRGGTGLSGRGDPAAISRGI